MNLGKTSQKRGQKIELGEGTQITLLSLTNEHGQPFLMAFTDWNRMYKVLKIVEGDATRQVKLQNLDTGAIELCFDDSALVSDRNFDFMQVDQQYDCKIKLFGKPVPAKTDTSITCKITRTEVMIGERVFTEVMTSCGVYYVPSKKIAEYLPYGYFEFFCTRKDLVQVNGTVHGDLCSD